MDTGEQSVTMDGIVGMLMLYADSLDSIHLDLFQEDILTLVEGIDQLFSTRFHAMAMSLTFLTAVTPLFIPIAPQTPMIVEWSVLVRQLMCWFEYYMYTVC